MFCGWNRLGGQVIIIEHQEVKFLQGHKNEELLNKFGGGYATFIQLPNGNIKSIKRYSSFALEHKNNGELIKKSKMTLSNNFFSSTSAGPEITKTNN